MEREALTLDDGDIARKRIHAEGKRECSVLIEAQEVKVHPFRLEAHNEADPDRRKHCEWEA